MLLQIGVTELQWIIDIFGTVALSFTEWISLAALSTAPLWFHELFIFVKYMKRKAV